MSLTRLTRPTRPTRPTRLMSPTRPTWPTWLIKPRPVRPTRPMPGWPTMPRSLISTRTTMPGSSLSPSQNVLQSLWKWRNILKQITINLDLDSTCKFDWCARALAPFKTGGSKGFEVVGIKSTINPRPQSSLHKIVEAGCAPSEHNAANLNVSINLKELLQMVAELTWWSCAWVARWIPGWSLAWITPQSLTWIIWRSFAWILWWIAWRNFTWIARWSFGCSPSKTEMRSTVVWAVEALWMNTTIRWSLELAGATCLVPVDNNSTINWSEKLAFFVVVIAVRSKSWGSKRPAIVIAGSFRTKYSKRFLCVA